MYPQWNLKTKVFQSITLLKCIVKRPYGNTFLDSGTFGQISAKYGCLSYKLKGDNEVMRINFEDLIDKSCEGSCIFCVYIMYLNACKTTFLDVKEIVVNGPLNPCKVVCNNNLMSESEEELSSGEESSEEN